MDSSGIASSDVVIGFAATNCDWAGPLLAKASQLVSRLVNLFHSALVGSNGCEPDIGRFSLGDTDGRSFVVCEFILYSIAVRRELHVL